LKEQKPKAEGDNSFHRSNLFLSAGKAPRNVRTGNHTESLFSVVFYSNADGGYFKVKPLCKILILCLPAVLLFENSRPNKVLCK
jgi:hypothetical protein